MVGRFIGLILTAWGGLVLLKVALRGLVTPPPGSAPFGHDGAYASGAAIGQVMGVVFAIFLLLAGLFLLFARSYGSNPRSRKKQKRRKIATPSRFDD